MKLVEGVATVDDLQAFLHELDEIADEYGCTVQAFDADYVVGPDHLRRAVELADRAIERGDAVARERGVEILLYAAGRRQIDRALEMGVADGELPIVVLVDEPAPSVRKALESPPGVESGGDDGGADGGDADSETPPADSDDSGEDTSEHDGDADSETDRESAAAAAVAGLLEPAATLGEYDHERLCSFFDISDAEREAVAGDLRDLVLERVALLDVEK